MPNNLQIAGLQRLSTVDWPGKLAAVAFLQGCPWACTYCHNPEVMDCSLPGSISWEETFQFLKTRRGLLDGMVFSGGEATRQAALLPAAQAVKELGFEVGLHTAGAYPASLKRLLEAQVIDWVGLDVKALPGDYRRLTGSQVASQKVAVALETLLEHPEVDYEVRLTLWQGGLAYAREVAAWCRDRGVKRFALQALDGKPTWQPGEAEAALESFGFELVTVR